MRTDDVKITFDGSEINGILNIPEGARAIVLFSHGSGSSRLSPRNQMVAEFLNKNGFATLLIDLLTVEEEKLDNETAELRFDIDFLAERLLKVMQWIRENPETKDFVVGLFGSSTGAAAALNAAAMEPKNIYAVVSRGGRPDLSLDHLSKIKIPVLLIVGELDTEVIEMNKEALEKLSSEKKLDIVSGATHLFEEEGALDTVANLAAKWFKDKLG